MLPQLNFGFSKTFHVPLDQFSYAFYTYNYSLESDIFEGEGNHIAIIVGMSCTINWAALQSTGKT